jgi:hypothetical protein
MTGFPDLDAVTREGEKTWAASESIRKEFGGNKEHYLAFVRADAKGLCRAFSGTVTTGHAMAQTSAPSAPQADQAFPGVIAYPIEARLKLARSRYLSELRITD